MLPDHIPDVALLNWPQDEELRRQLAAARRPRLLLVDADAPPPAAHDELEDWTRLPLDQEELAIRTATLVERAREANPRPRSLVLDADGVLRSDGRWVALPPLESRTLGVLLGRAGELVSRQDLVAAGWPGRPPADERALDGVVKRLRRRVAPLGVQIYTLRSVGYLLDYIPDSS